MHFNFEKNIQFTTLIKANGRLREFNFRKIKTANGPAIFSVNVIDQPDHRLFFELFQVNERWQLQDETLPDWIVAVSPLLNLAIEEALVQPKVVHPLMFYPTLLQQPRQ